MIPKGVVSFGVDNLNESVSVPCIGRLPTIFVASLITTEPQIPDLYILSYIFNSCMIALIS